MNDTIPWIPPEVETVFEGRDQFLVLMDVVAAHEGQDAWKTPREDERRQALADLASTGILDDTLSPPEVDWAQLTRLALRVSSGVWSSFRWEGYAPEDDPPEDELDQNGFAHLEAWIEEMVLTPLPSLFRSYFASMVTTPLSGHRHEDGYNLDSSIEFFRMALEKYVPYELLDTPRDAELARVVTEWATRSRECLGPSDFHCLQALATTGIGRSVVE